MVNGRNPKVKEKKLFTKMGYGASKYLIGKVMFGKHENIYELIPRTPGKPVELLREQK